MNALELVHRPPLHLARIPDSASLDRSLRRAFEREADGANARRSHFELGRYENLWIDREAIPEIEPLIAHALDAATRILGRGDLRCAFWFNCMEPGERTARHNHEEGGELLSGVYYLEAPPESGDLLLYAPEGTLRITPRAGRFVFFPPRLAHAVEENRSDRRRLSVAFNFGPAESC